MKRTLIAFLIVAFLLVGCASNRLASPSSEVFYEEASGMGGGAPAYPQESFVPMPTMMAADMAKSYDGSTSNVDAASRERMVVRNADLAVVVKDPETSMDEIAKLAEELGGFVVSSNLYQSYTPGGALVPEANVVIRVPAENLTEVMNQIKAGAIEVQSENVSGQDVTSTYVDLESQLKNLEAAEKQLAEIMSNAQTTEDVLNVYSQLTSIRGQIESIKGQMKYFEESAALSSVSVRLVAEETVKPIEIAGWKPEGTVRDAIQNLIYFSQDFVDFIIWFVLNFLPKLLMIGLVFGLPIWLIVRAVRSRRRKNQNPPAEEKK